MILKVDLAVSLISFHARYFFKKFLNGPRGRQGCVVQKASPIPA